MNNVNRMRIGVLKELKKIRYFFDDLEKGLKSRDPSRIYPAYVFISMLAYHMREGELSPLNIELHHELTHLFEEEDKIKDEPTNL